MIPFVHPANQIDQVDSEIKDMGFYMIMEKVINNPYFLGVGVYKYL